MTYTPERSFALELDEKDPLKRFRSEFIIPKAPDGREQIYFLGNSLGLQPRRARAAINTVLESWEKFGVEGFFEGSLPWMNYPERVSAKLAKLLGAKPEEVTVMNTLTMNLHLMLVSFYTPTDSRYRIVIGPNAFPSDRYAVDSHARFHKMPADSVVELLPRSGEAVLRMEDVETYLAKEGSSVALVMMDGVNYYSGQYIDVARIARAAHKAGALCGFDFAHGAGNVPLALHDSGMDFAVWCNYKYINGGPGAIGGCFVHERHFARSAKADGVSRFAGWWGNNRDTQFLMRPSFDPAAGAPGWQVSTHPALLMACLDASLDIFLEAGFEALRQKSVKLTGYLEFLVKQISDPRVSVITPSEPDCRGAALSLRFQKNGREVQEALYKRGVFTDWREPDVIRAAPVALYNTYTEVWDAVSLLKECLQVRG